MDVASLHISTAIAISMAAGVLSFFSPCVAPLLPGYLAFIAPEGQRITRSIGFITGFIILFALLGATAATISRILLGHRSELELISGTLVALFGLTMLFGKSIVPAKIGAATSQKASKYQPKSILTAIPIGAAFAIAWSPCIGPALAAILALAAGNAHPTIGALLLVTYGIGLGIPFLIATVALDRITRVSRFLRKHTRKIQIISGSLLAILGISIAIGSFGQLTSYLARYAPNWLGIDL